MKKPVVLYAECVGGPYDGDVIAVDGDTLEVPVSGARPFQQTEHGLSAAQPRWVYRLRVSQHVQGVPIYEYVVEEQLL